MKLSLWLRSLFSVADKETLLIDQKLAVLRRKIRMSGPNLIIFESRIFTEEFAGKLYVLYRALFPLIGLVRDFARNPKFIQDAFVYLVQARLPEPKSALEHFIAPDEMVEVLQDGEARDLRSEVTRRVDAHFEELPSSFYKDLQHGLEPLLYLRGLVLMPFAAVFSNFSYTLAAIPEREIPHFTSSSVALLLESMEKLYHGVFMALRLGSDWELHPELAAYYVAANPTDGADDATPAAASPSAAASAPVAAEGAAAAQAAEEAESAATSGDDEGDTGDEQGEEAAAQNRGDEAVRLPNPAEQRPSERARVLQQYMESIRALMKATQQFANEVPLLDIIRYFHRDPYYSLAFTVPHYYVRNIYTGAMRKKVLEELDDRIGEVERRVLNNQSEQLFGGVSLEPLQYYTEALAQTTATQNTRYLTHARSLMLLHNFLATVYRDKLRDPVQFLFNKVIQEDRLLLNRLGQHISGMEELRTAILLYDRSMAPDEEAGEALSRLAVAATLTGESRRFLRQTVRNKDEEAAALVKKGSGHIGGLQQSISDILSRPPTGAFAALRNAPIRKVLERVVATLNRAVTLLDQNLSYEVRAGARS